MKTMLPCETIYLLVKYAKCSLKMEASQPRRQIWVNALDALPTQIKKRADTERVADPNGQKTNKCVVRLGRRVGVALKAQGRKGIRDTAHSLERGRICLVLLHFAELSWVISNFCC